MILHGLGALGALFSIVFWIHWLADFVLQADWMAKGKSSSNKILAVHVLIYSVVFGLAFGWIYAVVNGVLHFITDYFTSRWTKKLWEKQDVHNFFVVIGLDQAIHLTCLFATLGLIDLWWIPG